MAKEEKIPVRVDRLVRQMQCGRVVCLTMKATDSDDRRQWWLEPGGKPVGEWTVRRALGLGLLEPVGDSLFPDETSQTYRLAQ